MAPRSRRPSKASVKAAADRAEARAKGEDPKPATSPVLDPPESKDEPRDPKSGRFLPGNRFWEVRSSAGPNPMFSNADDLWKACCEYFVWVDENPLWEDRLVTFQGSASHEPAAKMRAMTLAGLCLFLDVSVKQWIEWRKSRADLGKVITRAEEVIYSQKFAGAAADLLNANIIARDLGLANKDEISGPNGGPIETKETSDLEAARKVAFMLGRAVGRQEKASDDAPAG
jgi:hypothetical protein